MTGTTMTGIVTDTITTMALTTTLTTHGIIIIILIAAVITIIVTVIPKQPVIPTQDQGYLTWVLIIHHQQRPIQIPNTMVILPEQITIRITLRGPALTVRAVIITPMQVRC